MQESGGHLLRQGTPFSATVVSSVGAALACFSHRSSTPTSSPGTCWVPVPPCFHVAFKQPDWLGSDSGGAAYPLRDAEHGT